MVHGRDVLALGVAAVATAALGALVILPNVYPAREVIGYVPGTVLAYEFRATKVSAGGVLDVRLDRGEAVRLWDAVGLVPGDRVCLRATRRGELIEGYPVPMERCATP